MGIVQTAIYLWATNTVRSWYKEFTYTIHPTPIINEVECYYYTHFTDEKPRAHSWTPKIFTVPALHSRHVSLCWGASRNTTKSLPLRSLPVIY